MNNVICWFYNNSWKKGILIEHNENITKVLYNNEYYNVSNDKILPRNKIHDIDNLKKCVHLNLPNIIESVKERYNRDCIYTETGNSLIAINPFKSLDIYNDEIINNIVNKKFQKPHVYNIANNAYGQIDHKNQVILISGESGAGKTVSTKLIMNFLSKISANDEFIKDAILSCNPILEAFGNAKTLLNANSSRFGKFIKLHFNENKKLTGAHIDIYLLEKIRLTKMPKGEQNFHIFYMLNKDPENYNYLNKNKNTEIIRIIKHEKLIEAFKKSNFNDNEIEDIFDICRFILELGNLKYDEKEYKINCYNLGLDEKILTKYLKTKKIILHNESIVKGKDKVEFRSSRDTLAESIYECLFHYLVERINENIVSECHKSISLLDIFGFEIFKNNDFEQFCINYTNEKLQKIFNENIFENEQKEYKKENIQWLNIDFPSNNNILKLIENKKKSVFSYLIEQTVLINGSFTGFYQNMSNNLIENENFFIEKKDVIKKKFNIKHYAGSVKYNSNNFVLKNKNTFEQLSRDFIASANNCIINNFNLDLLNCNIKKIKNRNSITLFKKQLENLLNIIQSNNQHYIRTIKPNMISKPDTFNAEKVIKQFQYCGIVEAIRISRSGYPIRISHHDFLNDFYYLFKYLGFSVQIDCFIDCFEKLFQIDYKIEDFQIGTEKMFMKQNIYNNLIKKKNDVLMESITKIRSFYLYKKVNWAYKVVLRSIIYAQYCIRKRIRIQNKMANKIISFMRMSVKKKEYTRIRKNIVLIQLFYRNLIKKYNNKVNKSSKIIYKFLLGIKNNRLRKGLDIIKNKIYYYTTAKYFNILKVKSLEWNMSKIINLRIKQFLKKRKYENIELYILKIKKLKDEKDVLEKENSELKENNEKLDDEIYEMGTNCIIMDELKRDNNKLKMALEEMKNKLSEKVMSIENKDKMERLIEENEELKKKVKNFQEDQIKLAEKMNSLFLKIDAYEDIIFNRYNKKYNNL